MHLKQAIFLMSAAVTVTFAGSALAQAPAGATGECKDGSYTTNATKRGACSGHGGVKDWFDTKGAAKAQTKTPATAATPAKSAPASTDTSTAKAGAKSSKMPTVAAAGGGAGKVWVNTASSTYHCPSDKWYGKTKKGEYMSEADAKAKGNHPDHGKACS